ncbi:biotin carboxylase N-terminal domain-containing protein (plasmid) [Achromobacter denitrificans]
MFKRILIANRGEIARRIARTCQRLGIEYVSVHSLADAGAAHLRGAARTVCLGAGAAADSYLNAGKLLQAARDTGCEAVHPGYGFLSENSEFAASVEAAGMTFIGPSPATIAALGDKARAKALMRAAGVPVVPGTDEASDNPATVEALARAIELPILLKPRRRRGQGYADHYPIRRPSPAHRVGHPTGPQQLRRRPDDRRAVHRGAPSH